MASSSRTHWLARLWQGMATCLHLCHTAVGNGSQRNKVQCDKGACASD